MKIVLWTIFSLLFFPVLLLSNDCNMTGGINATVVESNNYESHIGSANIPISGEVIKRDDALVLNYIPLFNIGNLECSILEGYITNYTIEPVTNTVRGDFNGIGVCYSENGGQLILKAITIMGKVNGDVVCAESLVVTDCTRDSIECDADKCYCIKACNYETGKKDTLCVKMSAMCQQAVFRSWHQYHHFLLV